MIAAMWAAVVMGCSEDNDVFVDESDNGDSSVVDVVEPLPDELRPVLTLGKRWVTEYVYSDESKNERIEEEVVGDTAVNDLDAKIISRKCSDGSLLRYAEREEGSTVYKRWSTTTTYPIEYAFLPAYDICPEGDKLTSPISVLNYTIEVADRGTIKLCGKMRRAIKITYGTEHDYWVEGVGPLFGRELVHPIVYPSHFNEPLCIRLLECYDGEEKIYDHAEFSEDLFEPEVSE